MKKFKLFSLLTIIFMLNAFMFSESEGEKAFKENRPEEAEALLEEEIKNGTASSAAYNFLGLSYLQTGDYEKSVEAFGEGLKTPGTNKKLLAYNQGNSYFALKQYDKAVKSYSLALTADSTYYMALLNRANAYLMNDSLTDAKNDYIEYIAAVPEDPQKEEIQMLIDALTIEIKQRAEDEKFAAEQAARQAEEERLMQEELERQRLEEEKKQEEERLAREERERKEREEREAREAEEKRIEAEKKAAEAERRRKMLEDVANSLQNTDSTNMSSGAEDIIDYEQESELD